MRVAALMLCFGLLAGSAMAQTSWLDDPKGGPKGRATRVIISRERVEGQIDPSLLDGKPGPMLVRLSGFAAVVADEANKAIPKSGKALEQLRKAGTSISVPKEQASNATPWAWAHSIIDETSRDIEIVRIGDGSFAYRAENGKVLKLKGEEIAELSKVWDLSARRVDEKLKPAEMSQVPAAMSVWTMDRRLLGERFLSGGATTIDPCRRSIGKDKPPDIWIRLPAARKEKRPRAAGVLVWVDASPSGQPPQPLFAACDELNLIVAGSPDAGNDVSNGDRFQRVMDTLATIESHAPIDHRRVYISGISGGGRVSSGVAVCFADVFCGAAPIVGLSCYQAVPNPKQPTKYWRGLYRKPPSEIWLKAQKHRIGVMTGPRDEVNYEEIVATTALMKKDGMDIRVFDYADMGHTLPTPERFVEAMRWVDEPAKAEYERADTAAAELLREWRKQHASPPASKDLSDEDRAALRAVMDRSPWSPAAWEAAELLGLAKPAAK